MPPTSLDTLDPRWISAGPRRGMGLSFRCPHCVGRVFVFFTNPLDGGPPLPGVRAWAREGASFETVTLSPSVNLADHWHGQVQAGAVMTA